MRIPTGAFVVLLTLAGRVIVAAPPPTATVHFESRMVTAAGFTPGSQVIFFGVAKIPLYYSSRLWRGQFVATADGPDGTATVQTDFDIPATSVWVIADLRTGKVTAIATPSAYGVRTVPIGRSRIHSVDGRFSFDRSFLDLLYVHAGEGAWVWHAIDGGIDDGDGPNGLTTIDVGRAVRVVGDAPPKIFSPGGTLVAIDSTDLSVLTADVDVLRAGGGQ